MNKTNFCSVLSKRPIAAAFLNGNEKNSKIHGTVLFYQVNSGVVVRAEIIGLPSTNNPCKNPIFAFHIHSGSSCTGNLQDPFADTKGHYNPNNCPHPYHAGDLPPLFGVNGKAFSVFLTNRFTIPEILGKTLVIHSMPDDFTTQPSGNSGEKIACGIITPTAR